MATLLLESWLFFRRFNDENSNSKIDERHFSVDENRIDFKIDTILKPLCRGTDTQFSRGPVELDNLLLSNITLGRSAYECLSIINLSSLKHLTIYRCERPDFFLHSLGGLFQHLDTLNKHHAVMRRTPPANRPRAKEVLDEYGIPMSPTKLGKLPDRRGAVPYLDDSVDLDVPLTCKAVLRSLRYRCDELTYFSKSGITVNLTTSMSHLSTGTLTPWFIYILGWAWTLRKVPRGGEQSQSNWIICSTEHRIFSNWHSRFHECTPIQILQNSRSTWLVMVQDYTYL